MGWCNDDAPGHEGFLVALERITERYSSHYRELRANVDERIGDREIEVRVVQAACECGWRSQRLRAPLGTTWAPSIVMLPKHEQDGAAASPTRKPFETMACELWSEHCQSAAHLARIGFRVIE